MLLPNCGPLPQISQTWAMSNSDRKSTRLNSSHLGISYAVFCLKKKSNMQEVAARGGNIILMTESRGAREATSDSLVTIFFFNNAATTEIYPFSLPDALPI